MRDCHIDALLKGETQTMSTKDIVYIALFAAVTAAMGLFPPFPLPVTGVPIVVQNMGPMIAGSILGARRGFLSQALLLVLVAVGLPLLSGGRGGFAIFFGATGGFALSWAISALVIGFLIERFWAHLTLTRTILINILGGVILTYLIGIPWMAVVLKLDLASATVGSLPFIPGDLVKVVLASLIAVSVRRSYPLIRHRRAG